MAVVFSQTWKTVDLQRSRIIKMSHLCAVKVRWDHSSPEVGFWVCYFTEGGVHFTGHPKINHSPFWAALQLRHLGSKCLTEAVWSCWRFSSASPWNSFCCSINNPAQPEGLGAHALVKDRKTTAEGVLKYFNVGQNGGKIIRLQLNAPVCDAQLLPVKEEAEGTSEVHPQMLNHRNSEFKVTLITTDGRTTLFNSQFFVFAKFFGTKWSFQEVA